MYIITAFVFRTMFGLYILGRGDTLGSPVGYTLASFFYLADPVDSAQKKTAIKLTLGSG
jgi:hypothetical protein